MRHSAMNVDVLVSFIMTFALQCPRFVNKISIKIVEFGCSLLVLLFSVIRDLFIYSIDGSHLFILTLTTPPKNNVLSLGEGQYISLCSQNTKVRYTTQHN